MRFLFKHSDAKWISEFNMSLFGKRKWKIILESKYMKNTNKNRMPLAFNLKSLQIKTMKAYTHLTRSQTKKSEIIKLVIYNIDLYPNSLIRNSYFPLRC